MSRQSVLVFALLASVVLAGCASVGGPEGSPTPAPTPVSTPTPEPTPGQTPTPTPGDGTQLAPGVTSQGITNASRLFAANDERLRKSGYVTATNVSIVAPNGTVVSALTTRIAAAPGATTVLRRVNASRVGVLWRVTETWASGGNATTRIVAPGSETFEIRPREQFDRELTAGTIFGGTVRGAPYEVANVTTRDGTRFVTLTVDYSPFGDGTDRARGRLVVDEAGRIHEYDYVHEHPSGNTYRIEYRLVSVGGDGPAPPDWLTEVPPSAGLQATLLGSAGADGPFVVTHGGGDTVPAGTFVDVYANRTIYGTQLEDSLEPGETLYVYLTADNTLEASETSPDDVETLPFPREFTARVVTLDGVTIYEERFAVPEAASR